MSFFDDLKNFGSKLVKGGLPAALDFPAADPTQGNGYPVYWGYTGQDLRKVQEAPPEDASGSDVPSRGGLFDSSLVMPVLLLLGGVLLFKLIK